MTKFVFCCAALHTRVGLEGDLTDATKKMRALIVRVRLRQTYAAVSVTLAVRLPVAAENRVQPAAFVTGVYRDRSSGSFPG